MFDRCHCSSVQIWTRYSVAIRYFGDSEKLGKWWNISCTWCDQLITTTSHERHVVLNIRSFDCLFNSWWRSTSRKHQGPHYWSFVRGIHWWPVNPRHKGPVCRKGSIWWRHLMYIQTHSTLWFSGSASWQLLLFLVRRIRKRDKKYIK